MKGLRAILVLLAFLPCQLLAGAETVGRDFPLLDAAAVEQRMQAIFGDAFNVTRYRGKEDVQKWCGVLSRLSLNSYYEVYFLLYSLQIGWRADDGRLVCEHAAGRLDELYGCPFGEKTTLNHSKRERGLRVAAWLQMLVGLNFASSAGGVEWGPSIPSISARVDNNGFAQVESLALTCSGAAVEYILPNPYPFPLTVEMPSIEDIRRGSAIEPAGARAVYEFPDKLASAVIRTTIPVGMQLRFSLPLAAIINTKKAGLVSLDSPKRSAFAYKVPAVRFKMLWEAFSPRPHFIIGSDYTFLGEFTLGTRQIRLEDFADGDQTEKERYAKICQETVSRIRELSGEAQVAAFFKHCDIPELSALNLPLPETLPFTVEKIPEDSPDKKTVSRNDVFSDSLFCGLPVNLPDESQALAGNDGGGETTGKKSPEAGKETDAREGEPEAKNNDDNSLEAADDDYVIFHHFVAIPEEKVSFANDNEFFRRYFSRDLPMDEQLIMASEKNNLDFIRGSFAVFNDRLIDHCSLRVDPNVYGDHRKPADPNKFVGKRIADYAAACESNCLALNLGMKPHSAEFLRKFYSLMNMHICRKNLSDMGLTDVDAVWAGNGKSVNMEYVNRSRYPLELFFERPWARGIRRARPTDGSGENGEWRVCKNEAGGPAPERVVVKPGEKLRVTVATERLLPGGMPAGGKLEIAVDLYARLLVPEMEMDFPEPFGTRIQKNIVLPAAAPAP